MTSWGDWQYAGGNGMRVGMVVSVTPVTNASTSVTFTVDIYTQNQYNWPSDPMQLNYFDDLSGNFAFTNAQGTGEIYRHTKTFTHTYSTYGSSPGTLKFTAQIQGAFNGVTPYYNYFIAIPARPYAVPAAPSAVSLVRNTDTTGTLSWTRNSTTPAPYQWQTIAARNWYESGSYHNWGDWYITATVSGSATSFFKTTEFEPNSVYMLSVQANNSAGSSAFVDSNPIFFTPAAPSNVVSVLNSSGASITTTWTDNSYLYGSSGSWTIQRSVNGGAYANVGTVSSQLVTAFTDSSPAVGTNQYRVARVESNGPLTSAYTAGNVVSASGTAPLAPTLLSPNGVYVDFVNDAVVFTWQHNPGADGATQTHFTIEKSVNSGASWTALGTATDVASTTSSFTLAAGTLSNGVPYLWRVRTEGVVAAGYGPNSASATIQGSEKPTVTLTLPGATTPAYPIQVAWTYAQSGLSAQAAYQAFLYAADGTTLLEQIDGFDTTTARSFAYAAVSGLNYIVRVRARSALGVWSSLVSATTFFNVLPPATPTITGEYQPCTGTVLISMAPVASVPGTTVDAQSVTVERRVQGGDWVILGTGILIPTDFVDVLPVTNGLNEYRVTALSSLPSTVEAPILQVYGDDGAAFGDPLWTWISYGDRFEFRLRMHGGPQITETSGRQKAAQHFLGRAKPVALAGQNTTRTIGVSGTLWYDRRCLVDDGCTYDSNPASWSLAGTAAEVVCYRDFTGRRVFGVLSDVAVSDDTWPGNASLSYAVTEVDFVERYVTLVSA